MLDTHILIPYNVRVGELQEDVVLHPIRMRVVLCLGEGELTTREIQARMPDVPQATLYRAINRLIEAKRIDVVEHRKRGGATERVYRLTSVPRTGTAAVRSDVITLTPDAAAMLAAELETVLNRARAASANGGTPHNVSYSVMSHVAPMPREDLP